MKKSIWLAASALVLAAAPLTAQPTPSFSAERIREHVQTLSDDRFQGRAPATPGEQMTVEYLIRNLQAAGVQPGGEVVNGQRQWTQRVPLLKSDIVGTPAISMQTAGGALQLTQGEQIAIRSPLHGQEQVNLDNVPMVFAGYGVTAPERQWNDFKDVDVRGKVIVVFVNDPDFEGGEGEFGGKAMTYYGRWTYKFEEAARRGAAGVLVIHETEPASYGWATVKNSNTNTMFDIVRQNPAAEHSPVEGWIQRDLAARLFQSAGMTFEQAKAAAQRKDFRPVELNSTLDVALNANTEVITAYNVVGLLPGTERPEETVIYTAHHDHIGVGQPDANGDRIFNGAVDNSTGMAHVLEQARAFAQAPRTDRSVVFLFVGAEEKGLLGSEYYVANPLYPLSQTVAVLNTDSMGVFGPARNFSTAGQAELELLDMLKAEGARRGRSFTPDPRPEAGSFFRSDHFPFAKAGVPAISWRAGNNLVQGGLERGQALSAEYTENRYHQPDDEYQPDWNFNGIVEDAKLLFAVGYSLADSNVWPSWGAGSEFGAVRAQTAQERGMPTAPTPAAPPSQQVPQPIESDGERG